jgi:hypothetical protein
VVVIFLSHSGKEAEESRRYSEPRAGRHFLDGRHLPEGSVQIVGDGLDLQLLVNQLVFDLVDSE